MTIGFAATIYVDGKAGLLMAADSRASTKDGGSSDVAIKTYAIERRARAGAVGSGNAISIAIAVEMTRGIIADHNREKPDEPVTFYNIVRVFSYFLDRSERDRSWGRIRWPVNSQTSAAWRAPGKRPWSVRFIK